MKIEVDIDPSIIDKEASNFVVKAYKQAFLSAIHQSVRESESIQRGVELYRSKLDELFLGRFKKLIEQKNFEKKYMWCMERAVEHVFEELAAQYIKEAEARMKAVVQELIKEDDQ